MSELIALDISNNNISDISPLEGMQELYVTLHNNEITDVSPIVGVAKSVIEVYNNNISDVSTLSGCQDIDSVILIGNPIANVSQLNDIDAGSIIIDYDQDADYSVLNDNSGTKVYIYNVPKEKVYDIEAVIGDNVRLISEEWVSPDEETEETDE